MVPVCSRAARVSLSSRWARGLPKLQRFSSMVAATASRDSPVQGTRADAAVPAAERFREASLTTFPKGMDAFGALCSVCTLVASLCLFAWMERGGWFVVGSGAQHFQTGECLDRLFMASWECAHVVVYLVVLQILKL